MYKFLYFANLNYPMGKTFILTLKYSFLGILLISVLGSCSFRKRQAILKTPFDADTFKTVKVINGIDESKDYYNLIQPDDELAIRNLQDMSLIIRSSTDNGSTSINYNQQNYLTFRVNAKGEVLLPKLGAVHLAGLNRFQASQKIQQLYEKNELNAPLIDVRIANAYVILLGEVGKQGKYVIGREDYELIDLLADAGGININANKKMVRIFRGDRNNPEIILVNLHDYAFLKDPKLKLRAKDIVYVEPRRVAATSQNLQAYSSLLQIGLVVFNTLLLVYNLVKK